MDFFRMVILVVTLSGSWELVSVVEINNGSYSPAGWKLTCTCLVAFFQKGNVDNCSANLSNDAIPKSSFKGIIHCWVNMSYT